METSLRILADGTWVEVDHSTTAEAVADGLPRQVKQSLNQIGELLERVKKPITDSISGMKDVVALNKVEVELAIGFEGEGNMYIAKLKGSSNFLIRFTMTPNEHQGDKG